MKQHVPLSDVLMLVCVTLASGLFVIALAMLILQKMFSSSDQTVYLTSAQAHEETEDDEPWWNGHPRFCKHQDLPRR